MVKRLTAHQALRYLQNIELDCSDCELSVSENSWANDAFPCTFASDEELIVNNSSDEDSENDDAVIDSDDSDDEMKDFVGKNGSLWQKLSTFQAQRGRLQQLNVVKIRPGPTAFATTRVVEGRPSSSFRIMFSEAMLRNIQKCTISEAQRVTGNANWMVTLDKFIRLIITRNVLGQRGLSCSSLWNTT